MRIGFLAPLKAPDHPVPSGDRQMARQLMAALRLAGHDVSLYSALRTHTSVPDAPGLEELHRAAELEVGRLGHLWTEPAVRPHLLFTYHLYYKAPDLLGPRLARTFNLPYATAEASLSPRRSTGPWAERQALVADAVRTAALNICFTDRDRAGLAAAARPDSLVDLSPFIDTSAYRPRSRRAPAGPLRLMTVAMMRPGDKLRSYRLLGEALSRLTHHAWTLTVVGDGAARAEVHAALAPLGPARIQWLGAVPSHEVAALLSEADLFVWPGFAEAFGLCYLEAQASGIPVVAVRNAGTPSVIRDGETGLLTAAHPEAFAAAIARLIVAAPVRHAFGAAAWAFVHGSRGLPAAAGKLAAVLDERCGKRTAA